MRRTLIASIVIVFLLGTIAVSIAQVRQGRRAQAASTPTPVPAQAAGSEDVEPKPTPPPEDEAIRELDRWNPKKARPILEGLKSDGQTSPGIDAAWGLLHAIEGEYAESLEILDKATKAKPADPAAEYYRGEVLYWSDNLDGAKTAWKDAAERGKDLLETNPEDPRALYYRGAALVRIAKYEDAREALLSAKEHGFDSARVDYQIALTYAFKEEWNDAVASFDSALEEDSGLAYAYFFRGVVWKRLNRTDKMLNDLDRFLKLAPKAPDADKAQALLAGGQR